MTGILTLDLHGMNRYQAKIALDSALRRADASVYRIVVVHGFHGGSSLRDMLYELYPSGKVLRVAGGGNEGQTILVLREF